MQKPISWSLCGQICYIDGKAWGVTDKLQRICLGDEAEIKKKLAEGKSALQLVAQRLSEAPQSKSEPPKGSSPIQVSKKRKASVK